MPAPLVARMQPQESSKRFAVSSNLPTAVCACASSGSIEAEAGKCTGVLRIALSYSAPRLSRFTKLALLLEGECLGRVRQLCGPNRRNDEE